MILDYDNELTIVVNGFSCEYYKCGSHQMELKININKEQIDEFLGTINNLSKEE